MGLARYSDGIMRATLASLLPLLIGFPAIIDAAAPDFRLQKVADGVWAAIVSDEGLAGGNAGS